MLNLPRSLLSKGRDLFFLRKLYNKSMKKTPAIKKEMLISEVVKEYPQTTPVFLEHGLHCIGCAFAKDEIIEEAVKVHQINLDKFLKDLNKIAEK